MPNKVKPKNKRKIIYTFDIEYGSEWQKESDNILDIMIAVYIQQFNKRHKKNKIEMTKEEVIDKTL